MNDYVRLKNGREFDVSVCGGNAGMLFITMDSQTAVLQAAEAFSDETATEDIMYYENGTLKATYTGYTVLFGVMNEQTMRKTQIYMRRPEA